jgi:Pyridoxamine 5'-phosphate oxidase
VTASLPAAVQAVFAQFGTTELTTVDHAGQPITWPVNPNYRAGAPCIDVATGLDHPKKADDARANPLVALLFSDPAGGGVPDAPMVLVQGSAQVEDRKHDARVDIHVRPERVYVWPEADIAAEPTLYDAHMEEVRSGHSEEPDRYHASPAGGASAWSHRIAELGARYPTAVLSLISPDGFPFAARVPVQVDRAARWIAIGGAPSGVPFQPGLACLTAYESTTDIFQLRGDLVFVEGTWALIPHEVLPELEPPRPPLGRLRRLADHRPGRHG